MRKFDYLVIGSGIAGLVFALEVSKHGQVAVVTKKELTDCNTAYAQGGIAAVLDKADSFNDHLLDTFNAGVYLGKREVINTIVKDGPAAIEYLLKLGTNFTRSNDAIDSSIENLSLTKEGGHSRNRVAYAADSTGLEIMKSLIERCKENPNIHIFENHLAIDLITQHHVLQQKSFVSGINCWGAYVMDICTGKIHTFLSKKTMLATGGGGQVYNNNTNSSIATGDGFAMAKLAGARLVNMEFVQFHPTAFYTPDNGTFLITEALRGEGAVLRLQNGDTFMENYHKMGSLAPRDIVSRAIDRELKQRDDKYVLLDATHIPEEKLVSHFPYIHKKCLKRGIDFTKDPIPVVPAAHYFCGGILITDCGMTDVKNLFASGEVACVGLHGANRLASNSLLEGLVISLRASKHASITEDVEFPEIPEWKELGEFNENEWIVISHNRKSIKSIMQGYVGIIRSRRLLKYATNRIHNIYTEINNFYQHNAVRKEVIETRNLAITANCIIRSALMRKESRGLHYLIDYPERDDRHYLKDTII